MNPTVAVEQATPPALQVRLPLKKEWEALLTPEFLELLSRLQQRFEPRRQALLQAQSLRSEDSPAGFSSDTRALREGEWTCAPLPVHLQGRRIELSGPATRKLLINGLNSAAQAFVAQIPTETPIEDPLQLEMHRNLRDAVNRSITLYDLAKDSFYKLTPTPALLMLAPRPWQESLEAIQVNGKAISAGWLDVALFFFHNAHLLLARGEGPYFYLSQLETREEAKLWSEVFLFLESELSLPMGKIRISLLVETLSSLFELNEMLYALRDYAASVGCGCRSQLPEGLEHLVFHPELEVPPSLRFGITPSLKEVFSKYLIRTCHKRGIPAIGCMGSLTPYEAGNIAELAKFRADKVREVKAGFNGTRVGHPRLVEVAKREFDKYSRNSVNP